MTLTVVAVIFGVFAIGLIVLLIYKSTLTMHRDDQLFLDDASSHMHEEQTELLAKVNRLTIPVRVFSIGSGVFLLALVAMLLYQTSDGYFVGSNFPVNEKFIREETDFDRKDLGQSSVARHARWEQLMAQNKGKIDVAAAQHFLADRYDMIEKKEDADERTLDGHIDLSPRGASGWVGHYATVGAVQNKAADASMIAKMTFTAAAGHACGKDFKAAKHLRAHPEYDWQKPLQRDMDAYPWTSFSAGQIAGDWRCMTPPSPKRNVEHTTSEQPPCVTVAASLLIAEQTDPVLASADIPKYPPFAAQSRIQGTVTVTFTLAANSTAEWMMKSRFLRDLIERRVTA
jgi:hypothetical protein